MAKKAKKRAKARVRTTNKRAKHTKARKKKGHIPLTVLRKRYEKLGRLIKNRE